MYELAVKLPARLSNVEAIDAGPSPPAPKPGAQARMAPGRDQDAQLEKLLSQLGELAQSLQSSYRQQLQELNKAAVALAIAIAEKLIHQKLDNQEFAVEALVRHVVEQLNVKEPITVHLHPDDHQLLERRLVGRPVLAGMGPSLRFVVDPALVRGSCRAESAELRVVSHLDEQIEALRRDLLAGIDDEPRQPG